MAKDPAKRRAWLLANAGRVAAKKKAWADKNRATIAAAARAKWSEGREQVAGRVKPSACEVCGSEGVRIHFDHDHRTGAFRGWLCHGCNLALGLLRDSQWRLLALVDYLNANEAAPIEF